MDKIGSPYEINISKDLVDKEWDEFVVNSPSGQYTQTSLWAQVQNTRGWGTLRIVLRQNGSIVGGAQLLTRSFPIIGSLGYLKHGPICGLCQITQIREIINIVQRVSKQERIFYLAIKPPEKREIYDQLLTEMGYKNANDLYGEVANWAIDLNRDLDSILADMSNTKRNAIRRIERGNGINVRSGRKEDLSVFYRLHVLSSQRNGFTPYPEIFYQKLWEVFEPQGHLKLLVVEYEGEPITADLMILFKDSAIAYKHGWSGMHKKLFPNEAVYWEAIKWAKANGYQTFDFGEIDETIAVVVHKGGMIPEWAKKSFNLFKLEYGGNIMDCPHWFDKMFNPFYDWGYRKLYHWTHEIRLKEQLIRLYRQYIDRHE